MSDFMWPPENVKIYIDSMCGFFLTLKKVDSSFYEDEIDFKIFIIKNINFYYKTHDYDVISKYDNIYFFNNNFYAHLINGDNLIKYIEYGDFFLDVDDFVSTNGKKIHFKSL